MGKQVKRYLSLEFLETFSANNFALSDAEDNNSGLLNKGSIVDSLLLRTLLAFCQKSKEPSFWKVMDSSFISICESGSFKNPFARIINLPEVYVGFRRFTLWVQMKKSNFYNYGSSLSSWKPWRWVRLDLILLMRDTNINPNLNPLTKFTSSSRSSEFKDMLPWNISQMITKTVPISTEIVISNAMKGVILLWIWWKVNGNWDNMIRMSQCRESLCRTNALIRGIEIQNSRTVRITVWDPSRKVVGNNLTIWVKSFWIEKL